MVTASQKMFVFLKAKKIQLHEIFGRQGMLLAHSKGDANVIAKHWLKHCRMSVAEIEGETLEIHIQAAIKQGATGVWKLRDNGIGFDWYSFKLLIDPVKTDL